MADNIPNKTGNCGSRDCYEGFGSGVVVGIAFAMLFFLIVFGIEALLQSQNWHKFKSEARAHGYADWTLDDKGNETFQWKEAKP